MQSLLTIPRQERRTLYQNTRGEKLILPDATVHLLSNSPLPLTLYLEFLQRLFALVLDRNTYIPASTLSTHSKYCTPSPQNLASLCRMPSRRFHRRTRNHNAPKRLQTRRYVLETKIRYRNGHTTLRKLCRTILRHLGTKLCRLLLYKPRPLLLIH